MRGGVGQRTSSSAKHLPLVQGIARKVKRTLGAAIDLDDLVGYGRKGLVEAAERFDGRAGVAFTTFAYYRIRGAMYDGIRAMGWYSRADYARYRAEERANQYLQTQADREGAARAQSPDAAGGGQARRRPRRWPRWPRCCPVSPPSTSRRSRRRRASPTRACARPTPRSTPRRLSQRVREAMTTLPDKERQLMELYYFGDKNLEEAGRAARPVEVVGVPAARARGRPAPPGDGRRRRIVRNPRGGPPKTRACA